MKKIILLIILISFNIKGQSLAPVQYSFMQSNNINTVFASNGIFNLDKVTFSNQTAGFIWPVASSQRLSAIYSNGIWIGAKVGPAHELRLAASTYTSHYSPGNIPIIGQVPSESVCNDPSWRGYSVQLTDPTLVNGGTRMKSAGGRQYTFNYDSWAAWPIQKGAPYVEVNGIPGYQPAWNGDRPGIGNGMTARPDEIIFMVFMDYTNCSNTIHPSEISLPGGTLPLGVEIQQLSFSFNCPPLQNMYFMNFRIINKSSSSWDSTYFTIQNEPDIGDPTDDSNGCDTLKNIAFFYNHDNDDNSNYGTNPPAVGYRFLQSPVYFTGNNNDTLKLPYDTLTGYRMRGMTGFKQFSRNFDLCTRDPDEAIYAYNFMRGKNGCGDDFINWYNGAVTTFQFSGNACSRTGWYDSVGGEYRSISNSGPFTMNSGDTQIVVLSYMITRDGGNNFQNVCALQSISDSALKYYYNDFRTCIPIGIEPISSEIPTGFELFQNYPNPFNPTTKIKFQIPLLNLPLTGGDKEGVLLKIYDVLGKEISVLVNEELKPGTYEIDWDASNYPSGVYFYSLTAPNYSETRKMVLLK